VERVLRTVIDLKRKYAKKADELYTANKMVDLFLMKNKTKFKFDSTIFFNFNDSSLAEEEEWDGRTDHGFGR
jgi:hypothetical protein